MECFAHITKPAVGICKACGKGMCRACAIEIEHGLACSEECKPAAEALARLQAASFRHIGAMNAQRYIQPLFAFVFMFIGAWIFAREGFGVFPVFMFGMGGIMAAYAIMGSRSALPGRARTDPRR